MNSLYEWLRTFLKKPTNAGDDFKSEWQRTAFEKPTNAEDNFKYDWQRTAFKKATEEGLQEDQIKEVSEFSVNQAETFSAGASFKDAKEITNVYQRSAFVETGLPINLALKFANHPDQHMALFHLKGIKFGLIDSLLENHTPLIENIIEQCADRENCQDIVNFIRSSDSLDELYTKMGGLTEQENCEAL